MTEYPAAAAPSMKTPQIPDALAPLAPWIEAALAPAVALLSDPTVNGRSHFGGQPLGVRGARWPRSPARPMSFLGQIDLSAVAPGAVPAGGLLQLFYDVEEQKWGFDVGDRDWWQIVYIPEGEEMVPLPIPVERFPSFERMSLIAEPYLSLPSALDEHWSQTSHGMTDALWDAYSDFVSEWHATVFGNDGQAHQALGHADWVQGDARVEAESLRSQNGREKTPTDWQLLWQIASDDTLGFMWGDLGYLYLMAPKDDIPEADFSRCHLTLQCS